MSRHTLKLINKMQMAFDQGRRPGESDRPRETEIEREK